jgi:hypothetical protein
MANCSFKGLRDSVFQLSLVLGWGCVGGFSLSKAEAKLPEPFVGFFDAYCIDCHDLETAKGDFHIDLLKEVASVEDAEYWQLTLDNLHLGEMPPKKKTQPSPDEVEKVTSWIEARLEEAAAALAGHTGEVVLRRLNRTEFEFTIEDLFGVRGDFAEGFPEDAEEEGFDNNGAALMLSAEQVDQYWQAADAILEEAIATGDKPETQSVTFTLHGLNEARWHRTQETLRKGRERFDEMAASEQKQVLRIRAFVEENPLYGYSFPALIDGKLAHPTPEMGSEVPLVLPFNGSFATRVSTGEFLRVKEPGWYRFSLRAAAFQNPDGPSLIKIESGTFQQGTLPNLVAMLALPDGEMRDYEFEVYLQKNEKVQFALANGLRNAPLERLLEIEEPMAVVEKVSIEGPIIEQWPPRGHRLLLGERDATELSDDEMPAIFSELAAKLFRRPVSELIWGEYVAFYQSLRKEDDALLAFKRTVKAMLSSPLFLYHVEPGTAPDDYAIANRLSYFLWRSAPDPELLQLAADGDLLDRDTLSAQVTRLLEDEKSERFLKDFVDQWLWLDQVGEMQPDSKLYPEYDERLERAMVGETRAFIRELLRTDEPLSRLIDSDWAMLNDRLAEHYGIAGVTGPEFRRVKLDPKSTVRGGLLTHASILNVTSNGTTTSPVVRGVFVLDQILGTPAPPPPPDVPPIEPDIRGASTIQEQLAKHREIAQCSNCHQKIDPYGIALENFDVIGGWREAYRALEPSANPNRPKVVEGQPVGSEDTLPRHGEFTDFREFRRLLKKDAGLVYKNTAHKLATFALGRKMDFADEPLLEGIAAHTQSTGGGFRTLIHALVTSELFSKP